MSTEQYYQNKICDLEKRIAELEKKIDKPTIDEVCDYGQGYDDVITELFQEFKKFRDGYFGLINYGDNWWERFNQGVEFDEIMKEAWNDIDRKYKLMNSIEIMANNMVGTYVMYDKFVDAITKCYELGYGCRHKESDDD